MKIVVGKKVVHTTERLFAPQLFHPILRGCSKLCFG